MRCGVCLFSAVHLILLHGSGSSDVVIAKPGIRAALGRTAGKGLGDRHCANR